MSGYMTHGLIGAVGGLALARALEVVTPAAVSALTAPSNPFSSLAPVAAAAPGQDATLTAGLVVGSAFLALWPDIDEGNSYIARRARTAIAVLCAALLGAVGWSLAARHTIPTQPAVAAGAGALVGLVFCGPLLGHLVVRAIRVGAGGHRRLTHSFVLGGALVALAGALWLAGLRTWALIPAALAWGILLHDVGDLVTPAGLPVLYPFLATDVHALPKPLRPYGEAIVGAAAGLAGLALLWTR